MDDKDNIVYVPVCMADFNRWVHELGQIQLVMFAMGVTVDKHCDCPGIKEINKVTKARAEAFRSLLVEMRLSFGHVQDTEDEESGS